MQSMKIGRYTSTNVVVAYIEGIADPPLIDEITNRLKRIEIDGILESAYIEELIEDNPYSPFPQIMTTERPDIACSNLLEGRVVILVDGTPFCLIAPISFFSLLQSARGLLWSLYYWYDYPLAPLFFFSVLTFTSFCLYSSFDFSSRNGT